MSTSSSVTEFSRIPILCSLLHQLKNSLVCQSCKKTVWGIRNSNRNEVFKQSWEENVLETQSNDRVMRATVQMYVCWLTDRHYGDYLIVTLSFNVLWSHIHSTLSILTFPPPNELSFPSGSPQKIVNFDYQIDCIKKCPEEQRTLWMYLLGYFQRQLDSRHFETMNGLTLDGLIRCHCWEVMKGRRWCPVEGVDH